VQKKNYRTLAKRFVALSIMWKDICRAMHHLHLHASASDDKASYLGNHSSNASMSASDKLI
jgi:hypothetical protein